MPVCKICKAKFKETEYKVDSKRATSVFYFCSEECLNKYLAQEEENKQKKEAKKRLEEYLKEAVPICQNILNISSRTLLTEKLTFLANDFPSYLILEYLRENEDRLEKKYSNLVMDYQGDLISKFMTSLEFALEDYKFEIPKLRILISDLEIPDYVQTKKYTPSKGMDARIEELMRKNE